MAETKAPRRLDEALRPGGLYYTANGTAHDANGNVLEGAPKRPENTNPDDQPFAKFASGVGASGAPAGMDMRTLGMAIAQGLKLGAEGATDEPKADAVAQRDELASAAVDAKIKPDTPPVQTRANPELTPGGEAAAAAAASGTATPTTAPAGTSSSETDTGASSSGSPSGSSK